MYSSYFSTGFCIYCTWIPGCLRFFESSFKKTLCERWWKLKVYKCAEDKTSDKEAWMHLCALCRMQLRGKLMQTPRSDLLERSLSADPGKLLTVLHYSVSCCHVLLLVVSLFCGHHPDDLSWLMDIRVFPPSHLCRYHWATASCWASCCNEARSMRPGDVLT